MDGKVDLGSHVEELLVFVVILQDHMNLCHGGDLVDQVLVMWLWNCNKAISGMICSQDLSYFHI